MRALLFISALVAGICFHAPASAQTEQERARALFEEGAQAYEAGDFQRAATKMIEAYELVASPDLAFNVGRTYERMSEYDLAIRYFRIYLRSREVPADVRADITSRITALRAAKRRGRNRVFTAPPDSDALSREARTFYLRGVAMYGRGHYDAAMQAFGTALGFRELPEIYYNMAVTAARLDRAEEAVGYYREYIRLAPSAADRGAVEREMTRLRARQR
jgi:tetratricopeptide (TPR) repeat protein